MGYNTTIFILNDALDQLEKHPIEFVGSLRLAILRGQEQTISVGNYCNPVTVMKTAHADIPRLYFTHGNCITDISTGPQYREDNSPRELEYLRDCLRDAKRLIKSLEKEIEAQDAKAADKTR